MKQHYTFYNRTLHKYRTAQLDLLTNITRETHKIILIQEPHIDHLNLTHTTLHWRVMYPLRHNKYLQETRAVILISTKIQSNKTQQLKVKSSDIVATTINMSIGKTDIT